MSKNIWIDYSRQVTHMKKLYNTTHVTDEPNGKKLSYLNIYN